MSNNNFISTLNYGIMSKRLMIRVPLNKKNVLLSKALYREKFITSYSVLKEYKNTYVFNYIELMFSSFYDSMVFSNIKLVSKPGRRVYISYKQIKKNWLSKFNKNNFILSTSKGVIGSKEAMRLQIGGELLFICM